MFEPEINQSPNHTPHPVLPPLDWVAAIDRTFHKFARDFLWNAIVAIPLMYESGTFEPRLFLPFLGVTLWRTYRDILPTLQLLRKDNGD